MAFQKSICILMAFFITSSNANTFRVGGKDGWTLHPSESYNSWSGRLRFLINDTLLFNYDGGSDSVLVVNKSDYDGCNANNPITKMDGGNSLFKFDRSGPFYFITGNKSNCDQGQKLIVVVLALRNRSPPSSSTPPPSSAVSPVLSPSMSPVSPPSTAVSPVITPSISPASPPSTVGSPESSPSGAPIFNPPASSPGGGEGDTPGGGGGQSPGASPPSRNVNAPPPGPSAAAPPLSGTVVASFVTMMFALWGA